MKELDDAIYDQIRELCAGGDALADGEYNYQDRKSVV